MRPVFRGPLLLCQMHKDAPLVGHDNIGALILVEVGDRHLRAHARIVVHPMRNKRRLASGPFQFKPIRDCGRVGFNIARGSMRPETFAGDDVLQPINIHVGQFHGVRLTEAHGLKTQVRRGR